MSLLSDEELAANLGDVTGCEAAVNADIGIGFETPHSDAIRAHIDALAEAWREICDDVDRVTAQRDHNFVLFREAQAELGQVKQVGRELAAEVSDRDGAIERITEDLNEAHRERLRDHEQAATVQADLLTRIGELTVQRERYREMVVALTSEKSYDDDDPRDVAPIAERTLDALLGRS